MLCASCATQRPPSGGPVDTTPPTIVATEPANGTINFTGSSVHIEFDEYVDQQSFQKSVHVSPFSKEPFEIEWSGKQVELNFPSSLDTNRTYIISIGTEVRDVRAGNAMASAYTLAFSTGDSLDQGSVQGKVLDLNPNAVSLFAYNLGSTNPDTLNPSTKSPDYLVQSGNDGSFSFHNISEGTYRIFAVRDRQNNFLYDVGVDNIGILAQDISVSRIDSLSPQHLFHLTMEDTLHPFVQSVEATSATMLEWKLNESAISTFPTRFPVSIIDSVSEIANPILFSSSVPRKKFTYVSQVANPLSGTKYFFTVDSIADEAGNAIRPNRLVVEGRIDRDTSRPQIFGYFPEVKQNDVALDTAFMFVFSRAMRHIVAIGIQDSSGQSVPVDIQWKEPNVLSVLHPKLGEGMKYRVCLDLTSCKDSLTAKTVGDSTWCYEFIAESDALYGSIRGSINNVQDSLANVFVRVFSTESTNMVRQFAVTKKNTFNAYRLLPGKYYLDAYVDRDRNGRLSWGKAFPFLPAERISFRSDTIRVRAHWETKDVAIRFPN